MDENKSTAGQVLAALDELYEAEAKLKKACKASTDATLFLEEVKKVCACRKKALADLLGARGKAVIDNGKRYSQGTSGQLVTEETDADVLRLSRDMKVPDP